MICSQGARRVCGRQVWGMIPGVWYLQSLMLQLHIAVEHNVEVQRPRPEPHAPGLPPGPLLQLLEGRQQLQRLQLRAGQDRRVEE